MYFKNLQKQFFLICLLLISGTLFLNVRLVYSEEFSSSDYKVLDPVMNAGGYGSSSSFELLGTISQSAIGPSTGNSFGLLGGFLYFPYVSSPVVQVTAFDSQVSLSWTLASAGSGFTVSGYSIGESSVSGGPYSFTNVGNTL